MKKLAKLDELIRLQKQLIRQNWENYNLHLWAFYGKELREIKESPIKRWKDSDRYEQAAVFMIKEMLQIYENINGFSGEEKDNFLKEAAFWMNRPMMKKMWAMIKPWLPKKEKDFIDSLMK